jgi:uncharacterized protein (TIGR02147 family)
MDVYCYTDYRLFLKDSFTALQRTFVNLSIREILRRIGSSSPSYYKEVVIDGKKNMGSSMARKVAAFLKLDSSETDYFLALVGYNQAKTELERNQYYEIVMMSKGRSPSENRFLSAQEYEYLSSWEVSAVREFLHFYKNFKNIDDEERKDLVSNFLPKLTVDQIDKAIKVLESLKFIKKDAQGNYRKTSHNIRSVTKTPAAYMTLCQNMKHALEIINTAPLESRIFKNVIVSISSQTYAIIEKRIQEFSKEILDIVSHDTLPEDQLYSLGVQFFPLTKKLKGDRKS